MSDGKPTIVQGVIRQLTERGSSLVDSMAHHRIAKLQAEITDLRFAIKGYEQQNAALIVDAKTATAGMKELNDRLMDTHGALRDCAIAISKILAMSYSPPAIERAAILREARDALWHADEIFEAWP